MRAFIVLLFSVLMAIPTVVSAQTKGRVSVGASVTWFDPSDSDVKKTVSVGPLVRLNPRRGWGIAAALNWAAVDLRDPGGRADFARMRVRPLMAGVSYTVGSDRVLTSFGVVAGPSFNRVHFTNAFLADAPSPPHFDVKTSLAVRPGVGVTVTVAPRAAVVGFGGYIFNRPSTTYRDPFGIEFQDRWKMDALVLSVGIVYSLF